MTLTWTVTNQGLGAAIRMRSDEVWFATNAVLDANARLLTYRLESEPLAVGASVTRTNRATLPVRVSGIYHLFIKTDGNCYFGKRPDLRGQRGE